jgi:hypothetical protein
MFRFTIRDVLWLTVVVAVGLGWCMHSERLYMTVRRLEVSVEHEKAKKPTTFSIDGKDQILKRGERTFISVAADGSIQVATPMRQPTATPKR